MIQTVTPGTGFAEEASSTATADRPPDSLSGLFHRLRPAERESFRPEQIDALARAAEACRWGRHATDIRLSLPWLRGRYYLVLLAGKERRSHERRRAERLRHPLATAGNAALLLLLTALGTLAGTLVWTLVLIWYLES